MIMFDHEALSLEYGSTSPQAKMARELYAAAALAAALDGTPVPPLESLYTPLERPAGGAASDAREDRNLVEDIIAGAAADGGYEIRGSWRGVDPVVEQWDTWRTWTGARALTDIFDDACSGTIFRGNSHDFGPELSGIAMVAKAKSSPDIFTERQMKGREWDTPKQLEIAKLRKLAAFTPVAADYPAISHLKPVDTMWTGRRKRNADGSVLKDNARVVTRGDLHVKFYNVTSNDKTSPVVRNSSLMAIDAVSCIRGQHFCPYDVPGAYLQGEQRASEQTLLRPPVGFRQYDERGVETLWLMSHPLYGQADAGAIWNRTINSFMTDDPPKGCGFGRNANDPCVYSKRAGADEDVGHRPAVRR